LVQAIDDNIYSCKYGTPCELAHKPPKTNFFSSTDAPYSVTPFLPGRAIDSLSYRAWGIDSYIDIHLVILDDGTIWEWRNVQGSLVRDMPKVLIFSSIGIWLGVCLGFLIYRIRTSKLE